MPNVDKSRLSPSTINFATFRLNFIIDLNPRPLCAVKIIYFCTGRTSYISYGLEVTESVSRHAVMAPLDP